MRKSPFQVLLELSGFAFMGLLFFVWFFGYLRNEGLDGQGTLRAGIVDATGVDEADETGDAGLYELNDRPAKEEALGRNNSRSRLREPVPVATEKDDFRPLGEAELRSRSAAEDRSASETAAAPAAVLRSWKGVHRDGSFARRCYERYGDDVLELSNQHGLYPEVFMARIIAYSYDYMTDAARVPADNNLTAMKRPKVSERARFRSVLESLKAYAVVNAGEVTKVSFDGALAKHDRAWTMGKIIDDNSFILDMGRASSAERSEYNGALGSASLASSEENYKLEMMGEAIKLTSKVEKKVKERQAKEAGYDGWEEYVADLPDEVKEKQQENTAAVISAVSKKKAHNLSRRVQAKRERE
jgi:hypothetical protein